jgi:hypothetical protein
MANSFGTDSRKTYPGRVRGTADPSALPDFLSEVAAPVNSMWFSLRRTTCVVAGESGEVGNPGEPRDLRCARPGPAGPGLPLSIYRCSRLGHHSPVFVIPSVAEGSAVLRTLRGNAEESQLARGSRRCSRTSMSVWVSIQFLWNHYLPAASSFSRLRSCSRSALER